AGDEEGPSGRGAFVAPVPGPRRLLPRLFPAEATGVRARSPLPGLVAPECRGSHFVHPRPGRQFGQHAHRSSPVGAGAAHRERRTRAPGNRKRGLVGQRVLKAYFPVLSFFSSVLPSVLFQCSLAFPDISFIFAWYVFIWSGVRTFASAASRSLMMV